MNTISLDGIWHYRTDENNIGIENKFYADTLTEKCSLPASACENNIGTMQKIYTEMTKETVRSLRQHHNYTGAIWYQREIEIPESWTDKKIELYLERVMFFSDIWIDKNKVGIRQDSLSTPHIYDITKFATTGRHMLTLRIDNSNLYNIDTMASGYTDDTQSIWNGAVGTLELRAYDKYHISNLQVYPDIHKKSVTARVTINTTLTSPSSREKVTVSLYVKERKSGKQLPVRDYTFTAYHTRQIVSFEYDMGDDILLWDEFDPNLYELYATLTQGGYSDTKQTVFGMREIRVEGREFRLNGKKIFLRGNLDCCVYPETGYPPTDLDHWIKICKTAKEYGLNNIRFHSWCPPENAFLAADIVGIYILAEMPVWLNVDVCALAMGDDMEHHRYYPMEAERISRFYGNHPSFIMFSNGNELLGDFELLENIITKMKALDNRRVYTLTSNFDRPVTPADDYFSAFRANEYGIRCQYFHKEIPHNTCLNYDEAIASMEVPVVSFEVGQYCVYPDVREIDKYKGNLAPINFEVIRDDLRKKNLLDKVGDYVQASGKLAALLYKEDIEASLRTRDMGGIQLLGIQDYPGQCTATIGILNSFWESKGIISAEEFREFCSPVVPLMKAKRIFSSDESFIADFALADYGKTPINTPTYILTLSNSKNEVYTVETTDTHIEFPLDFITKPAMLKAVLSIKDTDIKNSWNIFVYPPVDKITDADLIEYGYTNKIDDIIKNGGKAVIVADKESIKNFIQGRFYPVFWSPAYFPSSNPCGIICDNTHSVFDTFPTDRYSDFQWFNVLENSVSIDIHTLPQNFEPIVELVPNFFDNTRMANIFEARVGNADILVCGFDLDSNFIECKHLRNSIINYVTSDKFNPAQTLDKDILKALFR